MYLKDKFPSLFVSVPENYNSLSAYHVRGLFERTSYINIVRKGVSAPLFKALTP